MADAEKVKFAFDIFDFDGKGEVDAFYIGDLLRAVDLNPSEKSVSQFGVPEKKGEKMIKITELEYILTALGEPMEKEQVRIALAELAPEEDEDGLIPYDAFL